MWLGIKFLMVLEALMSTKVLLDTDIGGDIDDAYCLAFLLASPEIDLVGITTNTGPAQDKARLVCKILETAGRSEIPVAIGSSNDHHVSYTSWAKGFTAVTPIKSPASQFIVDQANQQPGQVLLLAVGPLTNLAEALKIDPKLPPKTKGLVIMGGGVLVNYKNEPGPCPEYNIMADIPSAQQVFKAWPRLLMAGLDVTCMLNLTQDRRDLLTGTKTPVTTALAEMKELWNTTRDPVLYDPMAAAMILDPSFCTVKEMKIEVDDKGVTRESPTGSPVRACLEPKVDRFMDFFCTRLSNQRLRP